MSERTYYRDAKGRFAKHPMPPALTPEAMQLLQLWETGGSEQAGWGLKQVAINVVCGVAIGAAAAGLVIAACHFL